MRTHPLVPLAAAAVCAIAPAYAQNLQLDKTGGGLGGPVSCPVQGEPNAPFAVLPLSGIATGVSCLGLAVLPVILLLCSGKSR